MTQDSSTNENEKRKLIQSKYENSRDDELIDVYTKIRMSGGVTSSKMRYISVLGTIVDERGLRKRADEHRQAMREAKHGNDS